MLKKALYLTILLTLPILAQDTEEAVKEEAKPIEQKKPEIKKINENEYQIGKIHLDKTTREASFGAGVNMTEGLIEYLLATTQSDKVHETLFLTDISPFNLKIAIKLLGIKESQELFEIRDPETWRFTGKYPEVTPEVHKASLVDIFIEWGKGEKKKRLPVHEFIHHIEWPDEAETPQPNQEIETKELPLTVMESGPWLSTGSYLHEGRLKAEVGGIIFGIYTSQQALVNFPGKDRHLGDVWIPNKTSVPPVETVVKVILKPHTPTPQKK